MKFGLRYLNTGPNVDPAKAIAMAQAAEEVGFESVWTVDHVVIPRITNQPILILSHAG